MLYFPVLVLGSRISDCQGILFNGIITPENSAAGWAFPQRAEFILQALETASCIPRGSFNIYIHLHFILHSAFHVFASS